MPPAASPAPPPPSTGSLSTVPADYGDLANELGEPVYAALVANWSEARRCFSAAALDAVYLKGVRALHGLGRGSELVVGFVPVAPRVARELGEEAVLDLVESILRCSSKTSAAVLTAIVHSSPLAAQRLGERQMFAGYLELLETLLALVPRGVRPMLGQIESLLGQLTLGGLRRWARWGAQAHKTDFAAQIAYFGLSSPDALAVLQQERKGTLFVDVQRRLGLYLRALWGRDFYLRPTSGDYESRQGLRPYIEGSLIHVPDAYDDFVPAPAGGAQAPVCGQDLYRAALAHAAAHLVHTRAPLPAQGLNPLQMACVALVEDARVEALALRAFPGLLPLWARLHHCTPEASARCGDFLSRLARALLDPAYTDPHPLMAQARARFAACAHRLEDAGLSWEIGVALAAGLAQAAPPFQVRTDTVDAPYRDDNRYVWEFDPARDAPGGATPPWLQGPVRRTVGLMEFVNEVDVETAGADAQEIWVLASELFPYEDEGVSYNAREGREPEPEPHHYPEWDYQIQLERPQWVTVREPRVPRADPAPMEAALERHKVLAGRLRRLIEAARPQGVQRLRRLQDGDDIDLNAAIAALVQLRCGQTPDARVMMRQVRQQRDLAVLLLVDLSQSTADGVPGSTQTVLELAREASALMADALQRIGDPFALHGFSSDGRHDVRYLRFKDFDAPYDGAARARLAAMASGYSTRMGAALRHAGSLLARRPQARKLLLVLTDGEPADVDVRDPQYLRHDARKAVEELQRSGIRSYCLSLDPQADPYVARIFGARNYRVLDRIERLPEQLPSLYLGLTR